MNGYQREIAVVAMTAAAADWMDDPVTELSDAMLIQASWADGERFAEVYDRHVDVIHLYLARRVGSTVAEDLSSETFLVAFRLRQRYDVTRSDARPWLYGIATNLLRRHRRTESAGYRALARTGVDPLGGLDHAEEVVLRVTAEVEGRAVAAALARLTAKERDVLLLFAWTGMSYEQIAEGLDIPLGTVRSRLNRARERLRRTLDDTATTAGERS